MEMKRKIKVLRIIARLNIGGPAIHVALLTDGLDPTRFESSLVAGKVSRQEGDMSYLVEGGDGKAVMIPELQRDLNPIKDVKSFFRVLRILGREKPDIVDTHTAKAGSIGRIAVFAHNLMHRRKVRVVHTFHGHVFRGYFGKLKTLFFVWAERMLAKITDLIIVISESQKSELCGNYHIAPAHKFRVIPLGFDLAPFLSCRSDSGQWSVVSGQWSVVSGQEG
jgi:glycosyltransferase involved in cell wall biosynthesis